MLAKLLTTVFLVIILAGCATTRRGQDTQSQQLTNRINSLEVELERKNQEINSLEYGLERQQGKRFSLDKQDDSDSKRMSTKQIQTALKNAGFYKGLSDGKLGSKTKQAIRDFQKANGLKADGIAGKRTLAKLKKYLKR